MDCSDTMRTTKFLSDGGRAENLLTNLPSNYAGIFLPITLKYLN
jgi:hypothetical protein